MSIIAYPFGLFPNARINWSMSVARYPVFSVLFKIGVTLAPNGQPLLWLTALGVPTISIITELVSQYDAIQEIHCEFQRCQILT